MIVQGICEVFFALVNGILDVIPSGTPPAWLATGGQLFSDLSAYASGVSPWFPFALAGTVLTALLVCLSTGFVIKVVRIVASFFTAGGGSAA